jgi:hypothetical protein
MLYLSLSQFLATQMRPAFQFPISLNVQVEGGALGVEKLNSADGVLRGQCKTGHTGSLQNRPCDMARGGA